MKPVLVIRLLRIFCHIAVGMTICGLAFPWLSPGKRNAHIRRWSRQLLAICNVTVEQTASASEALEHAMIVSNHVSWLDIFVIDALHPCHFVAKSEIRAWPMLGWLAHQAGTVFISRGSKRDLRNIFKGLVHSLKAGERVGFFPEGTTSSQGTLLPFHANLFEAAIDAQAPVQPFALSYVDDAGRPHPSVDFIGDMTFAASMVAILGGPPVRARLACLPAISTIGAHRRDVAEAAQASVAGALGVTVGA